MNPKRILCIEDDTFFLGLITSLLQKTTGIMVIQSVNGEDGIAKAKRERPDLVLLDLMLPDIHGAEVILRIKEITGMGEIPIIVLSNFGDPIEVEQCLANGATAYLVKSNTLPSEVVERVVRELGVEQVAHVDPMVEEGWPKGQ